MFLPEELTALVVDDNDYAQILAENELRGLGLSNILLAADAVAGLDILSSQKIDVVLLDWHMPEIGGAGMVNLMRWLKMDVPIIIMTAYATKENAKRCAQLNLTNLVIKPFGRSQMSQAIDVAVRQIQEKQVNPSAQPVAQNDTPNPDEAADDGSFFL